jgi:hypothetical protein
MNKEPQTARASAIYNPLGGCWKNTIRYCRKDSVKAFLDCTTISWQEARAKGYKAIKVEIVPLKG